MDVRTFYGKKASCSANTLNNLLDDINEKQFDSADIYIYPPAEDSDGDSELSEDLNWNDFSDKLSSKILNAPAEATLISQNATKEYEDEFSEGDDEPLINFVPSNKTRDTNWERGDFSQYVCEENSTISNRNVQLENPVDFFTLFWSDNFFSNIKEETMVYARQQNANTLFDVSVEELKVFFAILFISGYSQRPRKHMYWSLDLDLRNEAIANAMSRNRFREILKNLHFADNTRLPKSDKFAKVRPLIEHLNSAFMKHMPIGETISVSVDESMVPYYSHHSCKQRIQGKPIRYGFKFWSQNVSNGYLVATEPYQGKGTLLGDSNLGLGASVVTTFAERLKQNFPDQKCNFFIDNFFTGLPLIKAMSELGYGCTGTIRHNRIGKCPLNKNGMKKSVRGSIDSYTNSTKNIIVIQWKDNSIVHLASNCYGVQPMKSARRYSAADKKHILVQVPYAIHEYNTHMGGTDLMDRNVANYRPKLRNNKWWWQVFVHLLSASVSNAWILYRLHCNKKQTNADDFVEKVRPLDLLGFIRSIVATYLLLNPRKRKLDRTSSGPTFRKVPEPVAKNMSVVHYPSSLKQNRCKICKKNTTFGCGICKINVHPLDCFKYFHENMSTQDVKI